MKLRRDDIRKQRPLIPLILITGFLGAGKTTLLRNLAKHTATSLKKKIFIILNDYQNAKVDASTFNEITEDIAPIQGSCVCCDSRIALLDTLKSVAERPQAPDMVLIEVNGTSDVVELIEILALADVTQPFELPVHINVIDLYRWQRRHFHNELERWQTAPANYIYYSRTDRTDPERVKKVREEVSKINPHANEIASLESTTLDPLITSWLKPQTCSNKGCSCHSEHHRHADHEHDQDHDHDEHEDGHHHHLSHGFNAVEVKLPTLLDEGRLQEWLLRLPEDVLRVKGVFCDPTRANIYTIFQLVQGYDKVEFMDYKGKPPLPPTAVIIGQNLNPNALQFVD
jgi:G3E family GTPase